MEKIQLFQVTPEELKSLILEGLLKELNQLNQDSPQYNSNDWLTRQDVATMLQIDLSTLYHWTKKGILTSYGISGRVYYKKHEVETALIKLDK